MIEKFVSKVNFDSYEDFLQNYKVNVPADFNFGYDVIDAYAEELWRSRLSSETRRASP